MLILMVEAHSSVISDSVMVIDSKRNIYR